MSWWLLPWWIVANGALGHVISREWFRWRKRQLARSQHSLMLRITRLELQLGVGLFYADEWLRRCPPNDTRGHRICWGCERTLVYSMTSDPKRWDPELAQRLCSRCIALAQAELEVL